MNERGSHLSPAVLLDLHEGRCDTGEMERARAHLESCGICRSELALAVSFSEEKGAADAEVTERNRTLLAGRLDAESKVVPLTPPPSRVWISRGLLAASVALIAFAGLKMSREWRSSGDGSAVRSVTTSATWGIDLEATNEGWDVTWSAVEGAQTYRLEVLTALGEVLGDLPAGPTGTALTEADLPAAVPGRVLFVRAVAEGPGGVLKESGPQELPRTLLP